MNFQASSRPPESGSPFPLQPLPWSRTAQLANLVWFALDTANRFVLLDWWGAERVEDLEFHFLRKHQETHFIDGLAKLGLQNEPSHVASARYHVLSNVLGGLEMGYLEDADGRCWMFYFPPSSFGASAMQPGPGILRVPSNVILAGMRAWHANNGPLLGDAHLRFTVTSLMSEGGAFDSCYFDRSDVPLDEQTRMRMALDTPLPVPGEMPRLGPMSWPQERREAALQKYSAQYAIGGLGAIAARVGLVEAARVARRACTAQWVSWARSLAREFGIDAPDPRIRMALLVKLVFELVGDQLEIVVDDGRVRLDHVESRLRAPEYVGWQVPPLLILEAMADAWTTASLTVGPRIQVAVERAPEGMYARWNFDLEGTSRG